MSHIEQNNNNNIVSPKTKSKISRFCKTTVDSEQQDPETAINKFVKQHAGCEYEEAEAAINKFAKVGLTSKDLSKQVKQFSKDCNMEISKLDVCYVAWESILEEARNKIKDILKVDIYYDEHGGEIHTAPQGVSTEYRCNVPIMEMFKKAVYDADAKQIEQLKASKDVKVVFEDLDIDIEKIRESKIENKENTA